MKVLVLTPALYNTSPGQRFRIEQWARYLEREGFEFTFIPFADKALHHAIHQSGHVLYKSGLILRAFARRLRTIFLAKHYDVVFLFREAALAGPAVIETLIARQGVPIVFDFDDAVWLPYVSPANKHFTFLKCFSKIATLCRLSQHITVGNPYLANYARRYNDNVTIAPTTIDTEIYKAKRFDKREDRDLITIGWTGSYSTVQHLDTLRPVLQELARRHPYRLLVIGTPKYSVGGVNTVARQWRAESEVQDLQRFDIGIMPLPNDNWSRGKCGLKLLQCMGVGVPAVGSPVGVNSEIIEDGVNGFLADKTEEWLQKLSLLIESPDLRRKMGLAGRKVVEDRYSAHACVPKFREVLESAASSRFAQTN